MGTGPAFDSHEEFYRGAKIAALVKALDAADADLDYVRGMGPVEWAVAAHAAGVKHPGDRTKAGVLAAFEARVARQVFRKDPPPESSSPLDGLGLRG